MDYAIMIFGMFLQELFAVNWSALLGTAIASGIGITVVTQLLKVHWIKIPARQYPRVVSVVLSILVGLISALATGLVLSSITTFVVFGVIAFIVSGLTYDAVKGLVNEISEEESY